MKHLVRSLALLLCLCLFGSACAEIPAYLHPNEEPLADAGITLNICVLCHDNNTHPEDTWTYKYVEQILGIKLKLTYFYNATRNESIALMMAGGDLPDIIISAGFSANELSTYGAAEGLLLDLAPYITPEIAPNLTALFEQYPQYARELTNSDGRMYSLGYLNIDPQGRETHRMFYNYEWMEALGIDTPRTLDEFMDMLRAFKAYGDTLGLDVVPFGGNYARYNATYLILNALGYNYSMNHAQQKSHETDIMIRDGKVVLPCYDQEAFPEYLEIMHTMYTEGLMEQDYYTLDKDTTKAHLAAGLYGVFSEVPDIYTDHDTAVRYFGGVPLTSQYNDTPFWPNYTGQTIGQFVVSAKTKYPELCVAFADYWYDEGHYQLSTYGPSVNQEELYLDMVSAGWSLNRETNEKTYPDYEANADQYSAANYWRYENICLWYPNTLGVAKGVLLGTVIDENGETVAFLTLPADVDTADINSLRLETQDLDINSRFGASQIYTWGRYLTNEFSPTVCYFDEATTLRVDELATLIREYSSSEIAKFVIGTRDLSELPTYFAELAALGADEYVSYYADYYAQLNNVE